MTATTAADNTAEYLFWLGAAAVSRSVGPLRSRPRTWTRWHTWWEEHRE